MTPKKLKTLLANVSDVISDEIHDYQIFERGWSNIIIEINNEWIARVNRIAGRQFKLEVEFLKQFSPVSPIETPLIKHHGDDYILYKKIEGKKLSTTFVNKLKDKQLNKLTKSFAEFFNCLHSFDVSKLPIKASPYGGDHFWKDLWPLAEKYLKKSTLKDSKKFFEESLDEIKKVKFKPLPVHSDLATNNVLVNHDNHSLSGIIDFSDLALNDPAMDFAGFYRHFGEGFVEKILKHYKPSLGESIWLRIHYHSIRKKFFLLHFAENYGYKQHIPKIVKDIDNLYF